MMLLSNRVQCSSCPIRHRAICAHCDDDELELLEKIKTYHSYSANEPILWRGDTMLHFSSVVSGVASLTKSMEDGRTQMVGLLLPSDFIGRPGRSIVEFDVTATTDLTLCSFKREPFEELVRNIPHIAHRMVEMALDELDAAREWMVLLGRKTAQEKIASFLEMLARRSGHPDQSNHSVDLPLTRDEIANFLGLTLETVSRQMSAFRKNCIIEFLDRRHFRILDMEALHLATGDDADGSILS